jgi:hypothetical protein
LTPARRRASTGVVGGDIKPEAAMPRMLTIILDTLGKLICVSHLCTETSIQLVDRCAVG